MKYNPQKHNRQSYRLKGYDYGSEGLYFITICTPDRVSLFGQIVDDKMILNKNGDVAYDCWLKIPEHFPHAKLHEFIIMPNHIHGIIEITENVGAAEVNNISPQRDQQYSADFKSPSKTIGSIVRGFKIGVTKWMRNNTTIHDVWQSNYYDHIIRNEESLYRIDEYIRKNPENWRDDKFYTTMTANSKNKPI